MPELMLPTVLVHPTVLGYAAALHQISLEFVCVIATSCGNDGSSSNSTDLLPVLITTTQSNVTQTTATCGGVDTTYGSLTKWYL